MSNYERMARVIRYLDAHYTEQPTLDELATAADLSPSHFHRLFSRWVGVTPKDFVQCLTMQHARKLLHKGESVLDVALDSGLSGPGRLHDLCVTLEAASPGELKNGGDKLEITYGYAASPFGDCIVGQTSRGICHLGFFEGSSPDSAKATLSHEWPQARLDRKDETAAKVMDKIFAQRDKRSKPEQQRAWVKGTQFQVKVWRALLRVPFGTLVTYGKLATAIGQPKAARAVGSAVGSNLLGILIPCHRVILGTGAIGQYRWGTGRKLALVAWEGALSREVSSVQ